MDENAYGLRPPAWPVSVRAAALPIPFALLVLLVPMGGAQGSGPAIDLPSEDLLWSGFLPLGDMDADGRDDVVYFYEAWEGEETASGAIALSMAGTREAWRAQPENGLDWIPDLDGNGINELLALSSGGEGTAVSQGVGGAYVYRGEFAGDGPARVLDGMALQDVGSFPYRYRQAQTQAYVVPVAAFAVAADSQVEGIRAVVAGPRQVFVEDYRIHDAYAYAGAVVTGEQAFVRDADATYTIERLDGSLQARLDLSGPTIEPFNAVAGRFAGGEAYAVAALWWETTPYTYLSQGGTLPQLPLAAHVAVATGEGADWTFDRPLSPDPSITLFAGLLALPDIDGDGADDLQYVEERLDVSAVIPVATVETVLLSGRTGDVLKAEAATDAAIIYYGFGEPARPGRLLRMDLDLGSSEAAWSVLERYDSDATWTTAADSHLPVNALFSDLGSPVFTDVGGDGVHDLVLGRWSDDRIVALQALDGRDGSTLWEAATDDSTDVVPVSTDGRTDLVVLTATGDRDPDGSPDDATAAFKVLDGATGAERWSQVLRSGDSRPVDSDAYFYLRATPLGDVDGDDRPDFSVSLQRRVSRDLGDYERSYWETTAYLFSSGQAIPLADSVAGPAGEPLAGLPPAVVAEPTADVAAKESPGVGALALVAGVVAAAVAVAGRRR